MTLAAEPQPELSSGELLSGYLLELLRLSGWELSLTHAFGTRGALAIARRGPHELRVVRHDAAEAVLVLFQQAVELR